MYINECSSTPCVNGATCTDQVGGVYTCSCVAGYTGIHCETDINKCDSNPCRNDGVCIDGQNIYVCDCGPRYTGINCEEVTLQVPILPHQTANRTPRKEGQSCHKCPPFWTHFRDNCYRFFGTAKTWDEAEAHCNGLFSDTAQGHLVSIHSVEESDFVYKFWHDSLIHRLLPDSNASPITDEYYDCTIYLGLHDRNVDGSLVWTDGSSYDYNEWATGYPTKDCTLWANDNFVNRFKWLNIPCKTDHSPFVCKLWLD
ncbi:echinoidin-like [Amphiura filiformis]|uniref:echinoidin-like n=1 Tax=Amphiura filiformis TaxID=82378 RepID=UPI003B21A575